ncbi:hypothetical protein [uncultured Clostridium sp.]|uniref:hypothetical protein n=1 Tax=uncultured Clostridium sp. TaxID=59620 RepID=UPI00258FD14B|nr:hypothetical protein [uncultured Clostridium sp.]
MNILFCNISWMKRYNGITKDDKPKNGGSYVDENNYANECFNFSDYNGKCYGFFMLNGDLNISAHFKGAKRHSKWIHNVLVVWVATNESNNTRIVGWYKNATIYREQQCMKSFINVEKSLYYNIVADSKDCYLLSEEDRTFEIERASKSGQGRGFGRANIWYAESDYAKEIIVPKVIKYINNYAGKFINDVFNDELINKIDENLINTKSNTKLLEEAIRLLDKKEYLKSLVIINSSIKKEASNDSIFWRAVCLEELKQFYEAIRLFERLIEMEGDEKDTLIELINCYDLIWKRDKVLEYCDRLMNILKNTNEDLELKKLYLCIMFDINFQLGNIDKAQIIINQVKDLSEYTDIKDIVDNMNNILKEEYIYS